MSKKGAAVGDGYEAAPASHTPEEHMAEARHLVERAIKSLQAVQSTAQAIEMTLRGTAVPPGPAFEPVSDDEQAAMDEFMKNGEKLMVPE